VRAGSVCRQIASGIISEAGVRDLIRRRIERVVGAGTVGVLVRDARHVAIAVVGKRQVVRGRTCGDRCRNSIDVVVRVRCSVAQRGIGRVLEIAAHLATVISGGGLRGNGTAGRIRNS